MLDKFHLRAVSGIKQACDDEGDNYPFFFLVGAGTSHPEIPLASEITAKCQQKAKELGRNLSPKQQDPMSQYSHWFEQSYPHPRQRKEYLKAIIRGKKISQANFRLAHLLLGENAYEDRPARLPVTNLVVTVNFDDLLSKALTIFGKPM